MNPTKETKAPRVERLKREKNAWDHLDQIRGFARLGHASIPAEWLGTYFRSWGIYTQGDGQGVIGGSGGEGRATPFFMVRIRVPNGLLTSHQLRTIADLSSEHGNGVADITVRQNIQLHWVRIESIPEILDRLRSIGLSTTGACGDVVRNITGCPLAGVHAHELADIRPLIVALDKELGGNPEFYNLPRKFKISVTACPDWCSYPEINDISLIATRRPTASVGPAFRGGPQPHPTGAPSPYSNVSTESQHQSRQDANRHSERSLRSEEPLLLFLSRHSTFATLRLLPRNRLLPPRSWRPFRSTSPRRPPQRLCPGGPGHPRPPRHHRTVPRIRSAPPVPRKSTHEIPFPRARLDR